jgi:hypothetical protein
LYSQWALGGSPITPGVLLIVTSFYNSLPNVHILQASWAYKKPDGQVKNADTGETSTPIDQQKEDIMNARTLLCGALVLAGIAACARSQNAAVENATNNYRSSSNSHLPVNLQKAQRNYLASLASTNEGVVQSAIANVAKFRLVCPGRDLRDLQAKISDLAAHGMTPAIRYRAYLASFVFDQPGFLSMESTTDYRDDAELFTAIANRLQKTLIGYNH